MSDTAPIFDDLAGRRRIHAELYRHRGERYRFCSLIEQPGPWRHFEVTTPAQREVVERLRALDVDDIVNRGVGLVFYGPAGTGKDHLAAAMMNRIIRMGRRRYVTAAGEIVERAPTVQWANGPRLFADNRDSFGGASTEFSLVRKHASKDVLWLSDVIRPQGMLTDIQVDLLYRIVDDRYSACKATIVTVNAKDGEDFEERLTPVLARRLKENAIVCRCDWANYSRARA